MTTITTVFNPPLPTDSPEVFNNKAFTMLGALNTWSEEVNTVAAQVAADKVLESSTANLTGGKINGTSIGETTPAPGSFTTLSASSSNGLVSFKTNDASASNNAGGGFFSVPSATTLSRTAYMWLDADGGDFAGSDYLAIGKTGGGKASYDVYGAGARHSVAVNGTEVTNTTPSGFSVAGGINVTGVVIGRTTSNGQVFGSSNGSDADFNIFLASGNAQIVNSAPGSKISTIINGVMRTQASEAGFVIGAGCTLSVPSTYNYATPQGKVGGGTAYRLADSILKCNGCMTEV